LQVAPQPRDLDKVLRAVSARCRLRFTYNGRDRDVAPDKLSSDSSGWSVTGFDETRAEVRTFYVSRMSAVEVGPPGSAGGQTRDSRPSTDPLTWEVDEPVTARLEVVAQFVPDAVALLGAQVVDEAGDAEVAMTARVTNRMVFLSRLIEMGLRVRLTGPEQLRAELDTRFLRPDGWERGA
jgi:predicted DNA-binding transcriptional regulator YafY